MNAMPPSDDAGLTRREVLKNMGIAATAAACATTGESADPNLRRETFSLRSLLLLTLHHVIGDGRCGVFKRWILRCCSRCWGVHV